eukprot:878652-Pleurochrysis_carterae.AAC.1
MAADGRGGGRRAAGAGAGRGGAVVAVGAGCGVGLSRPGAVRASGTIDKAYTLPGVAKGGPRGAAARRRRAGVGG